MVLNKVFVLYRILFINNFPKIYRPSSSPYLTGDSLRNFADFVFDETQSFNPKKVKTNDVVFLKTDLKTIFFENYHPLINSSYILITHNSDFSIEKKDLEYIDEKILHWFAAKLNVKSTDKISAIPYGIENKRYLKNGILKNFKNALRNNINKIDNNKVLCSFNVYSNPLHREPLKEIANKRMDLFDIKNFDNSKEYLLELGSYKFNLCPEGNNFESHRIWEGLILNTIPIVESNIVNKNFENLGVPMIILENFSELKYLQYKDLEIMNEKNKDKNFRIFTSLDYWINTINSKKI